MRNTLFWSAFSFIIFLGLDIFLRQVPTKNPKILKINNLVSSQYFNSHSKDTFFIKSQNSSCSGDYYHKILLFPSENGYIVQEYDSLTLYQNVNRFYTDKDSLLFGDVSLFKRYDAITKKIQKQVALLLPKKLKSLTKKELDKYFFGKNPDGSVIDLRKVKEPIMVEKDGELVIISPLDAITPKAYSEDFLWDSILCAEQKQIKWTLLRQSKMTPKKWQILFEIDNYEPRKLVPQFCSQQYYLGVNGSIKKEIDMNCGDIPYDKLSETLFH